MIEAYPLHWPEGWPRTKAPAHSRFHPTNGRHAVAQALLAEIRRLGGGQVVISTNVRLRNDGLPYSGDRPPEDKGVAVYFNLKGRQMVFACDKWAKLEDNLRSIHKTIEALRGIERWGASDMMERAFSGFTALPDHTHRTWRQVLGVPAGAGLDECRAARAALMKQYHPDTSTTPDKAKLAEVVMAYAAIEKGEA